MARAPADGVYDRGELPGVHDFKWTYSKDYSVSLGADRAAIQVR